MLSRRHVLAVVGSGLSVLGGCSSSSTTDDDTPSASPSPTSTPVPTEMPRTPTNASFETVGLTTTSVQCGDTADATITVEETRLTVVGTLIAPTNCYHASLRSASIQEGTAELDVSVSDDPTTETPCEQCRSEVSFELTGEFAGGRPAQIRVELHGENPKTVQKTI